MSKDKVRCALAMHDFIDAVEQIKHYERRNPSTLLLYKSDLLMRRIKVIEESCGVDLKPIKEEIHEDPNPYTISSKLIETLRKKAD